MLGKIGTILKPKSDKFYRNHNRDIIISRLAEQS